jgi:hypothetical protein
VYGDSTWRSSVRRFLALPAPALSSAATTVLGYSPRCGPGGKLGERRGLDGAARGIDKAVGVEHELARPGDGHASIDA